MSAAYPPTLSLPNGESLPLWSFQQLELLNRNNLRRRALDLHTAAGPDLSPQSMTGLAPDKLTMWIIDLQCALAERAAGLLLTPADFGVPVVNHLGVKTVHHPSDVLHMKALKDSEQANWRPPDGKYGNIAPSTNDGQWGYDERYLDAKVVSTKEQGANRAMHRGTLDTFLFGGGIHEPSAEEIAKALRK